MSTYPHLSDVDPALLTRIGASAMHALESSGWLDARPPTHARTMPEDDPLAEVTKTAKRKHSKPPGSPPRVFHSRYVGVTTNHGKYAAQWDVGTHWRVGTHREHTPEGERQAAVDRARALGLDYLELRDGTREAV